MAQEIYGKMLRQAFQCGMENEQTSGRKLTLVEVEGREHRDTLNFSPWDGRTQPQQDRTGHGNRTDIRHHRMKIRTKAKDQAELLGPVVSTVSWGPEIKEIHL